MNLPHTSTKYGFMSGKCGDFRTHARSSL